MKNANMIREKADLMRNDRERLNLAPPSKRERSLMPDSLIGKPATESIQAG